MTEELFRHDAYLRDARATVTAVAGAELILDRTVFYPTGGGQPGDRGRIQCPDGTELTVIDTRKSGGDGDIVHVLSQPADPVLVGQEVTALIDWDRRHRLMRMHTLLHLLCSLIPAGVTGGSIRDDGTGRLDFDLPESNLDKGGLTASLNELIAADHAVGSRWITADELDANPDLVRTMSVQPPRGQGRVRLLEIASVDLQPCGGTHVASTGEIGAAEVRKIEKKGRQNRRVNVRLVGTPE